MIFEVSKMLNFIGMSDALRKIYITSEPIEQLPLIISLLVNNEVLFKFLLNKTIDIDTLLFDEFCCFLFVIFNGNLFYVIYQID